MTIDTEEVTLPTIMHLIDTGGPGGAETVFSYVASRATNAGLRPLAVVPRDNWLSSNLRELGHEPMILSDKGALNIGYLRSLIDLIRKNNVKVIQTHLLGSAVYGALAGLITRTPVISTFHGPTDLNHPGRFVALKRGLIRAGCSAIVAVSTSTRDALLAFGLPSHSITLIQNGVDTELGLSAEDLLIAAVGNIRAPKAYDVLLRAAAKVLKAVPTAFFVVIGEGAELQMRPLLELRAMLGIESRFKFLGFRKSSSMLFQNFDIFTSSSSSEGLSLSFLEAMASGCAIVATRSGGPQDAIDDGVSGLLVSVNDPDALARALETAARDPELRAGLGAAARARAVQDFSLQSMIDKYQALQARYVHSYL
jgi:glycosyltransferase involved in cell wall biosynthesis